MLQLKGQQEYPIQQKEQLFHQGSKLEPLTEVKRSKLGTADIPTSVLKV